MATEKVITIKTTEQKMAKNNNPYLEIIAQDDTKYSIFDQGLWNILAPNLSVKLSLEKKGNFWNVMGAESVKDALEAKQAIEKQDDEHAPQEVGMWWKEAGETLRHLTPEKAQHPMYIDLRNAYLHKMFDVLGIEMKHEAKKKES